MNPASSNPASFNPASFNPAWFARLVQAELRKVLTRASGLVGLGVAAVVGALPVLVIWGFVRQMGPVEDELANPMAQQVSGWLNPDLGLALGVVLTARNFFVLPMILLMVVAQLVAGEWGDRTLAALLVRPVPRWAVLWAKITAGALYAAATVGITLGVALGLGLPALGMPEDQARLGTTLLGFAATLLSDIGLIAIGALVSTFSRSVVGVVVGTALVLLGDLVARGLLRAWDFLGLGETGWLAALLPGRALAAWEGWSGGWEPGAFGGLGLLILVCSGLATWRFGRQDVP